MITRPLPFGAPDRLVMMWESSDTFSRGRVAPPTALDWNDRNVTFDVIAGFSPGVGGMVMNGADGTAETVPRQWVTSGFFDVLGIEAIAGRMFLPSDDNQRLNAVVRAKGSGRRASAATERWSAATFDWMGRCTR